MVVRSFSKAHAMAGPTRRLRARRATWSVGPACRLRPRRGRCGRSRTASAVASRRRAAAARERERLAAALEGTPFSFPPGHGPFVWLSSTEHDGAAIASGLAAQRVYVTPGSAWGDERHVRVTLRDAAATDRLSDSLREL